MLEAVKKAIDAHDKPALKSKKFVAYIFTQIGFFFLMGMMLHLQEVETVGQSTVFMVLVITAGVLACAMIGGQALVDTYVRVAMIALGKKPGALPEPEGDPEEEVRE